MSNPSFSNIDQWLFELNEGNLSPEQIAQLEVFLMQHPELDVDLDMWELSYVSNEPLIYPHQDKLEKKRPVFWYWTASSAAIFAIIFSSISIFNSEKSSSTNELLASRDSNGGSIETSMNHSNKKSLSTVPSENVNITIENNRFHQVLSSINGYSLQTSTSVANNYSTNNNLTLKNLEITDLQSSNGSIAELNPSLLSSSTEAFNIHNNSISIGKLSLKRHHFNNERDGNINKISEEEKIEDWTLHRKSVKHGSASKGFTLLDFKRAIQKMADNPIALKNLKDPHYHVPGMQAVDINFGAVGTLLATRVQTNTRYQWMGKFNDQLSNSLLIDGYVYAIRGGIGLQVNQSTYHNNGYQNTFAAITYSPKFSLNKNITIEPAFRFKMGNQRINSSKFAVGQMVEFDRNNAQQFYSENEAPIGKAMWYKDFGLSVMVNTKWFYAGAQFDNLAQHQNNIYGSNGTQRAGIHSIFTVGTDYESQNHKLGFSPYLVYQNYQNLSEAWLGANFRASWFTVGAAVSSNAEPAASLGVKFKHFALTYNADYTKSMITNNYALSHQLTLRFLTNPSRVGQRLLNY